MELVNYNKCIHAVNIKLNIDVYQNNNNKKKTCAHNVRKTPVYLGFTASKHAPYFLYKTLPRD